MGFFHAPSDNPFSFGSGYFIAFQSGYLQHPNSFAIVGFSLDATMENKIITLKEWIQNSNTFRISNIDSSSHTITIHRVSKNKTLLHCAILYYTNDCAALINMDMMDSTMTSTKVWSICGPESPTASISNGDLKISIRPWRNVTLIMPGNEFSATLSD